MYCIHVVVSDGHISCMDDRIPSLAKSPRLLRVTTVIRMTVTNVACSPRTAFRWSTEPDTVENLSLLTVQLPHRYVLQDVGITYEITSEQYHVCLTLMDLGLFRMRRAHLPIDIGRATLRPLRLHPLAL